MKYRIGFGYDIHRLEKGKRLYLGGVLVSDETGAVGHSDADVLIHAICDSLLGAIGKRDIGFHFPDTSPEFKGISSLSLLEKVMLLVEETGYKVEQIDSTICLEYPKISPFVEDMKRKLAKTMNLGENDISVKATTKEGLGSIGNGEGLEAYAVSLLSKE